MSPEEIQKLAAVIAARIQAEGLPAARPSRPAPEHKALVLGPTAPLTGQEGGFTLLEETAYTGPDCLSGVERVYITALTRGELADIAQGRDDSRRACAVTSALLQGIPVYLLASALGWRSRGRSASPRLIQVLEGYVSTLGSFGVQLVEAAGQAPSLPEPVQEGQPRLITEAWARKFCATGAQSILLEPGTILTPSAKDVLKEAGVAVHKQ